MLLPDGDSQTPYRDACRFRGWPVELFVHDEQSLTHYLDKGLRRRNPSMHRMVAHSAVLLGDPSRWRAESERVLAEGPTPLTADERDYARYALTDLLDDLVHAVDPGEKAVIAATAWTTAAQQVLAFADHWAGEGKWLLRELRELDPPLADRWVAAFGDIAAIEVIVRAVLDRIGGPLFEGFHAGGERPSVDDHDQAGRPD